MKHLTKAVFTAILSVIALTMLCVGLAGCTPVTDNSGDDTTATTYYMSSASKEWATYDDAKAVPSDVLFVENDGVYTLSVELVADEQISFHKIGEEGALAVELFSEGDQLVAAEDNRLTAMRSGSYTLTLTEGDTLTLTYEYEAAVESVSIITAIDTMRVDDVIVFEAEVVYADGNVGSDAVWTSSDDAIISITPAGEATAIAVGTATLTATAGAQSADIEVAVVEGEIVATSIVLDKEAVTMEKGDVITLTATVLPINATDKTLVWRSDDNTLVNVKEDGTVTASQTKSGTTNVTVSLMSHGSISANCAVTVREPVTAISAVDSLSIVAGSPRQLTINFTPANATNKDVTVEVTSGSEYLDATAEGGIVTLNGKAEGAAKIVVTSVDNEEAAAIVDVKVLAEGQIAVELDCTDFVMGFNVSKYITANIIGEVENPTYTWTSSSDAITLDDPSATMPNRVLIHAGVVGHSTITCTVNGRYSASVVVTAGNTGDFYVTGMNGTWNPSDRKTGNIFSATETEGIYELERHFDSGDDIRILFANMNSDTWTGQIDGTYYNTKAKCPHIELGYGDQINMYVRAAGTYLVKLDTTGEVPVVTISVVKLDVTAVNVAFTAGAPIQLESGTGSEKVKETSLVATITPSDIEFNDETMKWSVSGAGADHVTLDATGLSCKVILASDVEENCTVTVTFTVNADGKNISSNVDIMLVSEEVQIPVSQIKFGATSYSYDVTSTSAYAYKTTIKATVNADASNKMIQYSCSDSSITFSKTSATSGTSITVTAQHLGTYTIKATPADGSDVSAEVKVLFYAVGMRLVGDHDGWENSDDNYKLTMVDGNTAIWHYDGISLTSGNKFRIYLGLSGKVSSSGYWNDNNRFGGQYLVNSPNAIHTDTARDHNIQVNKTGVYNVTVDLSEATPKVTVVLQSAVEDPVVDYTAIVKMYGDGDGYYTSTPFLTTPSSKFVASSGADGLTITFTFNPVREYAADEGLACQFAVSINGNETWYGYDYALTEITVTGSKYSSSDATGKFKKNGGGLYYSGALTTSDSFTFTLTLNKYGVLTNINID